MPRQDVDAIRQAASGRWPEILAAVGGIDPSLLDGKHHPCPRCGGTDRFRLIDENAGAVLCNQCFTKKNGDGIAAVQWLLACDFKTAAAKLADYLGIKSTAKKDPAKDLEWKPWSSQLCQFYLRSRPGITEAAVIAAGGRMARYKRSATVIAFPIIGDTLDVDKSVGWVIVDAMGGTLPRYNQKGEVIGQVKTKVTFGSGTGFIGVAAVEKLKADGLVDVVWKCEGISDSLTVASLIPGSLADRHVAITNANGAGEKPRWMAQILARTRAHVLHDADEAGQAGAKVWASEIAAHGGTVAHVTLPYEIAEAHGKDVRDWIAEGHDYADLQALADASPLVTLPQTAAGEIDHSNIEYPVQELILKRLQLEVLYEDEKNRVRVFSTLLRKSSWIAQVDRLKQEMLLQICGSPAMTHVSSDPDGENTWSMADVRKAIALMAAWRRGRDDERGIGIWQGMDDQGNELATVVLVGDTEGARWNGDGEFSRILAPRADGLVLDFGAGSEEWYEYETLKRHLESAADESWRRDVVDQAREFFGKWRWQKQESDPTLLAGLVLASWIQTIWEWRPLVAITGESNSGKTMLFEALGGTAGRRGIFHGLSFRQAKSTEAGFRQGIGNTARVPLCDEFEKSKERDKIFELLRASTRGEAIARGTTDQKGRTITLRHIGWVAAVESGQQRQPDLNRYIQLEVLPAKRGQHGKLRLPDGGYLADLGDKLLAVAVRSAVRAKRLAVFLKDTPARGIDARTVESYAVPAAILGSVIGYSETQTRGLLVDLLATVNPDDQGQTDEDDLVADLLSSQINCGVKDGFLTVGQIIESEGFYHEHSSRLEASGIRRVDGDHIFVASRAAARQLLRGTQWEGQRIAQILARVDGAERSVQRIGGKVVRGVTIPIDPPAETENDWPGT